MELRGLLLGQPPLQQQYLSSVVFDAGRRMTIRPICENKILKINLVCSELWRSFVELSKDAIEMS